MAYDTSLVKPLWQLEWVLNSTLPTTTLTLFRANFPMLPTKQWRLALVVLSSIDISTRRSCK